MPADNYVRRFTVGRVIDGDTIVVSAVDLGYHTAATEVEYRLLRVNCPETNRPASRPAGLAAKAFTADWLAQHVGHDPGFWLYAATQKTDSFGRYLAEVACGAGHSLSDALLISGNAVPYP